jgi:hypothetical protein
MIFSYRYYRGERHIVLISKLSRYASSHYGDCRELKLFDEYFYKIFHPWIDDIYYVLIQYGNILDIGTDLVNNHSATKLYYNLYAVTKDDLPLIMLKYPELEYRYLNIKEMQSFSSTDGTVEDQSTVAPDGN